MDLEMKEIITKVISNYWRPYEILEFEIKKRLADKNVQVDSVFLTGDINNMYVYVQNGDELGIFNKNSDISNAFLLKECGIDNIKFNNGMAMVKDFKYNLNDIPKVCLINMCVLENFPIPRLNLSTGAIAAYLRKYQKARVKIADMQLRVKMEDIEELIKKEKFDLIGISISFGQKELSDELINRINMIDEIDKSTIVVGNVIPSLYSKYYLKKHEGIIVSYREGEESFLDLVDYVSGKKNIDEVRGIAYIDKTGTYRMNNIGLLNIEHLPFPAIDTVEDVIKYKGALTLELSRGCNYSQCTFCPRAHKGARWRGLSVEDMILYFKTLEDVCKKIQKEPFFYIADEEFIGQLPHDLELKRIEDFCNKIKELNINVKFDISARVDSIFKPQATRKENIDHLHMWKLLKDIGLQRLFLGVESGSDNQLKRFNKGTTASQNAIALQLITALGINTRIGYISFDPLMENFDDIKESHKFVERKDVLYKTADLNKISLEEVYDEIVEKKIPQKLELQNKPLYLKVSYPLTSLEVLFGTMYAREVRECEQKNDIALITGIDMNMARYNSKYLNERVGMVSDCCQRWIDYNFPVLYSLKGLYKTSKGESKNKIYGLMSWAKSIDHYLLNYIVYQFGETENDEGLQKFAELHNFEIKKFDGTYEEILNRSLNSWQNVEAVFIDRTRDMLYTKTINDTSDFALTRAIGNWQRNRGTWNKINDKEEEVEER